MKNSIVKFAAAALTKGTEAVVGGGGSCPPLKKGNNGFGNGSDAPNILAPGNSGKTGGGKEFSVGDDRGRR
jgi:hypothetical protein